MDIFEKQNHLNNLKAAQKSFKTFSVVYSEISDLFEELIKKIEDKVSKDSIIFSDRSGVNTNKLKGQSLLSRKIFIANNTFNEFDIANLSGLMSKYIANNVPTLELFPGSGQFLPFSVSAEPFYIADRYLDICKDATKILNNDFYANRRLRKYEIPYNDMSSLPQESFGIVYCFNEFFFANEEYIIDISKQVYDLLYEGGKWIFNFLPNDQIWAQKANMEMSHSIIDYKLVIDQLIMMGFVLEDTQIRPLKSSYMVFSKGGSVKFRHKIGGGTAEIIDL